MDFIYESWPWYVAGPSITLVMLFLLLFGETFGVSANFSTLCSIAGAGKKIPFFNFNWKSKVWNIVFAIGGVIGGCIAGNYLTKDNSIDLNPKTIAALNELGITNTNSGYVPEEIFNLNSPFNWVYLIVGGFLIGFGTRYAGGCTSGHAISGLSNLQIPSLIAVIGFFIGGLFMTHILLPLLF